MRENKSSLLKSIDTLFCHIKLLSVYGLWVPDCSYFWVVYGVVFVTVMNPPANLQAMKFSATIVEAEFRVSL